MRLLSALQRRAMSQTGGGWGPQAGDPQLTLAKQVNMRDTAKAHSDLHTLRQ